MEGFRERHFMVLDPTFEEGRAHFTVHNVKETGVNETQTQDTLRQLAHMLNPSKAQVEVSVLPTEERVGAKRAYLVETTLREMDRSARSKTIGKARPAHQLALERVLSKLEGKFVTSDIQHEATRSRFLVFNLHRFIPAGTDVPRHFGRIVNAYNERHRGSVQLTVRLVKPADVPAEFREHTRGERATYEVSATSA